MFWIFILIKPLGEITNIIKNKENDIILEIQKNFTITNVTTKFLDEDKKKQ